MKAEKLFVVDLINVFSDLTLDFERMMFKHICVETRVFDPFPEAPPPKSCHGKNTNSSVLFILNEIT